MKTSNRFVLALVLLTFALGAAGCGHSHTERIVEREVPASGNSTTVVTP